LSRIFVKILQNKEEKKKHARKKTKGWIFFFELIILSALWLKEHINLPNVNVVPSMAFLPGLKQRADAKYFGAGAKRAGRN